MPEMNVFQTHFCSFYQATEVFQASLYVNANQEVSSLKDIPSKVLNRELPTEHSRGRWSIKGGEHWLEFLNTTMPDFEERAF